MKRFNLLNKIYLVVFAALVFATGVKIFLLHLHNKNRYYYSVTLTAPDTYPVFLQDAYMVFGDGERNPIDDQRLNEQQSPWCRLTDFEIRGKYLLPKALVLAYASYRDKKYYNDSIPLPAALIDSIFKNGVAHGILKPITSNHNVDVDGLVLLIGIANNGNIVIWLQGKKYEKKLGTWHISPKKPQGELWRYDKSYKGDHLFDVFNDGVIQDDVIKQIAAGKDSHASYADSVTHYLEWYQ